MTPDVSILVCTHDRAAWLRELVDRLVTEIAGRSIELIVVDSASAADQAAEVAAVVAGRPQLQLIRVDQPGLSIARNAGLQVARAPWIAILDDDEMPSIGWAAEVQQLAQRLPPTCAACGGNIVPIDFERQVSCLSPRWRAYLSLIDRQGEFDQTAAPRLPIGHSLVRAAAIRQAGAFDRRLGRVGSLLLSCEEVLLIHRLIAADWTVWHSDRLVVGHRIPAERLTRRWAIDRSYWEGISTYQVLDILDRQQVASLASRTALRLPVLRLMCWICPRFREIDLRLAFARGFRKAMADHATERRSIFEECASRRSDV